jgi:hypothetical protein
MTPEKFRELWNPARPLAGDTKGASYRTSREDALDNHLFIQTHPKRAKKLIVLDYDGEGERMDWLVKEQAYDLQLIPEPNYITINPSGGCHVGYFIEQSVGTDKGISWFNDVFEGLKDVSGSDPNYTGDKTRNPTSPTQVTEWGTAHIYTLKELAAFTKPKSASWYEKKNKLDVGNSRTLALFDSLSAWSYREWRKPNFETRIILEAHRINSEFDKPLPVSSLLTTVRSIEGFIKNNFSEAQFSKIQSNRANRRWKGQGQKTNEEILAYLEAGFSVREISESMGKSLDATRKAVQRAKKTIK